MIVLKSLSNYNLVPLISGDFMAKKPVRTTKPTRRPLPTWAVLVGIVVLLAVVALVYFFSGGFKKAAPAATPMTTPTTNLGPEISVDDAFLVYDSRLVTVLDVRSTTSWKAYHIEKTINFPIDELSTHLQDIPRTGRVIIFDLDGGGQAQQAYEMLTQAGFPKVSWVQGGMDAWVQKRYPYVGTAPY